VTDIVYQVVAGAPDSVTFARRSDAEGVAQIWVALNTANTWGEFRAKLPEGEWEENLGDRFDESPPDGEPFDAGAVPGHLDGDYPQWLRQTMLKWFPQSLIDKYGDIQTSVLNGDFLDLPAAKVEEIAADLRAMGHTVDMTELDFGFSG
jgi:hypothetical protein